jgi:hypothetical protein
MRPVPAYSTDLLYKSDMYADEDLRALGNALGLGDIKVITKTTLKPERLLYHACLNGVQTYVRLDSLNERERAGEIADITDSMYAALKDDFLEKVKQSEPELTEKRNQAMVFCRHIHAVEQDKPWDPVRYANSWNTNDYPMRWQKKAIDSYRTIRTRIENGLYTPRDGETAGDLTTQWSLMNMRYKHHRDIAREPMEDYIRNHIPAEKQLHMHPVEKRSMVMFLGGMGSGKSALTQHYLSQLPEDSRSDMVLHNADYLKYALYRSAKRDGVIPPQHCYVGSEIQSESSNALYEATRKRGYLARQKYHAPNVVLNSIVLGNFEIQEGVSGGGDVVAHHIFMPVAEAVDEANTRALVEKRSPSAADVEWSATASAKSLLLLTEPAYHKLEVAVHLYKRGKAGAPVHYGTIDAAHSMMYVHDAKALAQLAQVAYPQEAEKQALQTFIEQYQKAGFSIAIAKDAAHEHPVATLSPDKRLQISDTQAFEALGDNKDVFLNLASNKKVGAIQLQFPVTRGELSYGRA